MPLSAIQSPLKSKQSRMGCFSTWQFHLYHKPDSDLCELKDKRIKAYNSFVPGTPFAFLGQAWVSPTLIIPRMYLCIIYPTFVTPWFSRSMYTLKYSVYSGILMCSHAWFTTALNWAARTTGATRVCCEDYWWRQVGECTNTWYKLRIQHTETVEL